MDERRLIACLLEDLEHAAGAEERGSCDPAWLRGYVAGMVAAAQIALELGDREQRNPPGGTGVAPEVTQR